MFLAGLTGFFSSREKVSINRKSLFLFIIWIPSILSLTIFVANATDSDPSKVILNIVTIAITIFAMIGILRILTTQDIASCLAYVLCSVGIIVISSASFLDWQQDFFGGTPKTNLGGWAVMTVFLFQALRSNDSQRPAYIVVLLALVTGARSAMVAGLVSLFLSSRNGVRFSVLVLTGLLVMNIDYFAYILRIDEAVQAFHKSSFDHFLNRATSGRWSQYLHAFEAIPSLPFFGIGFDYSINQGFLMHNLFARLWLEGGFLYAFIFYVVPIITFYLWSKSDVRYRKILFSGILLSLVEPNFLIGTWSYSISFWIAFAILAQEKKNENRLYKPAIKK